MTLEPPRRAPRDNRPIAAPSAHDRSSGPRRPSPRRDGPRGEEPQDGRLRGRVERFADWIVRERNPEGVVYGTILVGSLIAAESGVHDGYPDKVGSIVLAVAIYWLARSYSTVLGRRLSHEEHLTPGALRRALAHDWSIVRGALVPLLALLLAWALGADEASAVNAAVWAAIASLLFFELAAGLRARSTPRELALEGAVGAAMGLAILALKALAH